MQSADLAVDGWPGKRCVGVVWGHVWFSLLFGRRAWPYRRGGISSLGLSLAAGGPPLPSPLCLPGGLLGLQPPSLSDHCVVGCGLDPFGPIIFHALSPLVGVRPRTGRGLLSVRAVPLVSLASRSCCFLGLTARPWAFALSQSNAILSGLLCALGLAGPSVGLAGDLFEPIGQWRPGLDLPLAFILKSFPSNL